jgi:AcrR family transcriptional regulator
MTSAATEGKAARRRTSVGRPALERADWIGEGRNLLIAGGIGAVKVGHLARKLKVTREAFYWHFKGLEELCEELIADWERGNAAAYRALLDARGHDGLKEFKAVVNAWINEEQLSPAWDAALRDWARTSSSVARAVKRVDMMRIGVLERIFRDMGIEKLEAAVRARVMYFHQVGYYSIKMHETPRSRRRLLPMYLRIITGKDLFD